MHKFNDIWTQKARALGFPSRAMFKLLEANKRYRILKPGAKVVDLGCAPGSWSKLASQIVGKRGTVYAVDLQHLTPGELSVMGAVDHDPSDPNLLKSERKLLKSRAPVFFQQADVTQWRPPKALRRSTDVILSDMAPKTTGIRSNDADLSAELCHSVLDLARVLLKPSRAAARLRAEMEAEAGDATLPQAQLVNKNAMDSDYEGGDYDAAHETEHDVNSRELLNTAITSKKKVAKYKGLHFLENPALASSPDTDTPTTSSSSSSASSTASLASTLSSRSPVRDIDTSLFVDEDGELDRSRMRKVLRRPALVTPLPREEALLSQMDRAEARAKESARVDANEAEAEIPVDTPLDGRLRSKGSSSSSSSSSSLSSRREVGDANVDNVESVFAEAQSMPQPRARGILFMKAFQGEEFKSVIKRMKAEFAYVHTFKPASSRSESVEVFLLGRGYLGPLKHNIKANPNATSATNGAYGDDDQVDADGVDGVLGSVKGEFTPAQRRALYKQELARKATVRPAISEENAKHLSDMYFSTVSEDALVEQGPEAAMIRFDEDRARFEEAQREAVLAQAEADFRAGKVDTLGNRRNPGRALGSDLDDDMDAEYDEDGMTSSVEEDDGAFMMESSDESTIMTKTKKGKKSQSASDVDDDDDDVVFTSESDIQAYLLQQQQQQQQAHAHAQEQAKSKSTKATSRKSKAVVEEADAEADGVEHEESETASSSSRRRKSSTSRTSTRSTL